MNKWNEKWSLFFQTTLHVSGKCEFRCLDCPVWQSDPDISLMIDTKSKDNTFAHRLLPKNPLIKVVNVLGGDPFENEYLPHILSHIKAMKKYICLWTHGMVSIDIWDRVIPMLDRVMIHLPSENRDAYRLHTGRDAMPEIDTVLQRLKRAGISVVLNHKVQVENVDSVPDVVEFAYQKACALLLHYDSATIPLSTSRERIDHYRRHPNIWVCSSHRRYKDFQCRMTCTGIEDPIQVAKNIYCDANRVIDTLFKDTFG